VEVALKILDGKAINRRFWVFYGSLSNLAYTIGITDTATGETRAYQNPAGTFASIGDTSAFVSGTSDGVPEAPMLAEVERMPSATCTPGSDVLCLGNGRFSVRVNWKDFQGNRGVGRSVPLSGDTGYFWFFNSSNLELVIKILDGRGLNGRFWVFYGALSNVEYEVEITDMVKTLPQRCR
jgi:hypothetical protein